MKEENEKVIKAIVIVAFRLIGWGLCLYSMIFAIVMTRFFGGNWLPETIPELLCDIAALLILLVGLFLLNMKNER